MKSHKSQVESHKSQVTSQKRERERRHGCRVVARHDRGERETVTSYKSQVESGEGGHPTLSSRPSFTHPVIPTESASGGICPRDETKQIPLRHTPGLRASLGMTIWEGNHRPCFVVLVTVVCERRDLTALAVVIYWIV